MIYRVTLARQDDDAVLVSFPDFPGVHATGEYEEDALVQARSALTDAVARCMRERRPVPPASRRPAPPSVRVQQNAAVARSWRTGAAQTV